MMCQSGISIALPINNSGYGKFKAILLTALSGVTTGIGAFFGAIIGNVSKELIGISLAFAAGAMIYVVVDELIPESQKGELSSLGTIGVTFGFLLMMVLDVTLG